MWGEGCGYPPLFVHTSVPEVNKGEPLLTLRAEVAHWPIVGHRYRTIGAKAGIAQNTTKGNKAHSCAK